MASIQCNNSNPLIWLQAFCPIIHFAENAANVCRASKTMDSSLWDRHSWVKHAVKIPPMRAANTVPGLEIIRFQNLQFVKLRGLLSLCLPIAQGQTAAGCNEHLETSQQRSLISWYDGSVWTPLGPDVTMTTLPQHYPHRGVAAGDGYRQEFHVLKAVWTRTRPLASISLFIPPNL